MCRIRGPADVDIQCSPDRKGRLVDGSERDAHAKRGRHRTARHMPDLLPPQEDAIRESWDPPVFHADADEPRIVVPSPLPLERVPSDEIAVPLHEPRAV